MTYLPVSILIPTMNRPDTLKNTLDSFFNADYLPRQIVIVDQSEELKTRNKIVDIIKKYSFETKFLYCHQPIPSLTKARNQAIQLASQDIIIVSDDDINIYSDTLYHVHRIMSQGDIAMIAGLDDMSKMSSSKIGYFLGTKSFTKRKIGHVTPSVLGRYPAQVKGQISTEWAMGYFFAVRKSLVEQWNICWDENLTSYAYAEDLDFSYSYYKKAMGCGLKCILDEDVHVKHLGSKEYRVPSKKSTYMYVINRLYISYKHNMGAYSRFSINIVNHLMYLSRLVKRENPEDLKNAIRVAKKYKKEIKAGHLNELYSK